MYIATALKPVFNAVDNIYVPGGCSKFYTEKGFTNVKELYSYDIDSKDNYIYVKVNPNYDFVKINKVSFWDRDMFYYMDMTYDENEKGLRCGSPWIAQQTCKPKDYHRTVHVFQ